jgi:altronate dehydratase
MVDYKKKIQEAKKKKKARASQKLQAARPDPKPSHSKMGAPKRSSSGNTLGALSKAAGKLLGKKKKSPVQEVLDRHKREDEWGTEGLGYMIDVPYDSSSWDQQALAESFQAQGFKKGGRIKRAALRGKRSELRGS